MVKAGDLKSTMFSLTYVCAEHFIIFFHTFPFPPVTYIYIHVVHCLSKLLGAGTMSLLFVSVMPSVREPLFFKCFFIKINKFTPYNDNNLYLQER